ncbi:hypothetical protein MRB53_019641 [Persea americana]|uniref:Uncharacterized protein n=1 Tax=Persea americana TaxID=3435 RepID=A0ACC2KYM6_PERAE|nr:hypothetical protein MRB53_019641 [Persea americana]
MELLQLQSHRMIELLLCLLFFFFQATASSSFTPSDQYLINCGSSKSASAADDDREFQGDSNSKYLSATSSITVNDPNPLPDTSPLYRTARLFTGPSSYHFPLQSNGTLVVRLHFYPVSCQEYNVSSFTFDVSVSGFQLLSNFNVQNTNSTPKEYFLKPTDNKLEILFSPSRSSPSSFAFVNAIEVFSTPDDLIADSVSYIPTQSSDYNGLLEQALETRYRINVGGLKITPSNDTLWRTWVPDEGYLKEPEAAKKAPQNLNINYERVGVSPLIAPPFVYGTAQEMNTDNQSFAQNFNITWLFPVNPGDEHLVRLHFCDILIGASNQLVFHVYINFEYAIQKFDLSRLTNGFRSAPYYIDFIVNSDHSEHIKVSVGPTDQGKNAFLNGVEIMKVYAAPGSVSHSNSKKPTRVLIGLASGGGLVLICVVVVVCLLVFNCIKQMKQKPKPRGSLLGSPLSVYRESTDSRTEVYRSPHLNLGLVLSFAELQSATNNFDMGLLIGSGGFGNVYEGVLREGTKVAVKRCRHDSSQGLHEFLAEIRLLSKIYHRHLVSLIGYCEENSEMILVYEFMDNGTLRNHLYGEDLPCLSWKQRLEICIGSARGIHYLHTCSAQGIVHRDVKSANILLDQKYLAKVADFGLSRSVPNDHSNVLSTNVKGSFGYLDPEYFKRHHLTQKSDVYSFGVVLVEVLCAKPVIDLSLPREEVNLTEWALGFQKKGLLMEIIDPRLKGTVNPNSLRKFGETAEKCLAEYGDDRPTMGEVLWNLEYALQLQETAMHREPHQDSTVTVFESPLMNVRRLPSASTAAESDDLGTSDACSDAVSGIVFSQLMGSEGR